MGPEISVVVPLRNESPNVGELCTQLTTSLGQFGRTYEIICVDDGSTDDTFDVLGRLQAQDPHLRVIRFRRHFGQTAGFAAGFAHARGRFIVTMDGDLQNDSADIPAMVEKAERENLDIVAGWRKDRKDPFINRRLPSIVANTIISRTTGVRLHDYGCSLKVFRAEVVKPLRLYGEMHRFLPAIASEFGASIGEMVVSHHARKHGKSKYGITRTLRVLLDLLTVKFLGSYSTRPLQMFGGIGLSLAAIGMLACAWVTYQRFFGYQSANRPLLFVGIMMFLGGIQLLMTGLLGEMLSRTYHESQDKPIYAIREIRETLPTRPREVIGA